MGSNPTLSAKTIGSRSSDAVQKSAKTSANADLIRHYRRSELMRTGSGSFCIIRDLLWDESWAAGGWPAMSNKLQSKPAKASGPNGLTAEWSELF